MGVVKFVDFFVPLEETIDGQKGGSASELDLPGDGIGGAPGLHGVEQIAGEDRLILARDAGATTDEGVDLVEGGRLGGRRRMERQPNH